MDEKTYLLVSGILMFTGSFMIAVDAFNLVFTDFSGFFTAGISLLAMGIASIGLMERKEGRENIFKAYLGCAIGIIIASILENWIISSSIGVGLAIGSIYYLSVNRFLPELKENQESKTD